MDQSITQLKPEDLAKIQADLKAEATEQAEANPIEQAMESADAIRESLASIKGEKYARLVEIGVLIHKESKLMAFVTDVMTETLEGFGNEQRSAIGHVSATLCAKILSHASMIFNDNEMTKEDAKELTGWIDKIMNAEERGIESLSSQLFGKEDE